MMLILQAQMIGHSNARLPLSKPSQESTAQTSSGLPYSKTLTSLILTAGNMFHSLLKEYLIVFILT